jgi:hypothetical protein
MSNALIDTVAGSHRARRMSSRRPGVKGRMVAAFSLWSGLLSRGRSGWPAPCGERGAHFSFGAWVVAECSWELSRLLNSMRGRQATRKQRELAETVVEWVVVRGRAGLNGCSRERTCQAAIRTLRATADLAGFLPARLVMSL